MLTIPIWTVLALLFFHFIADFVCQTDEMATRKSKENQWLVWHVVVYTSVFCSLVFFAAALTHLPPRGSAIFVDAYWKSIVDFLGLLSLFALVNGLLHFATDYVTSRVNSYFFLKKMRHWFFVGIGIDQFIHYATIILTYKWILG